MATISRKKNISQEAPKKTYFICSDIHGFYDEWHLALREAGFSEKDPNHVLIVLGDIFDRGSKPYEVYRFLRRLPENRRILVRGNHELLIAELVDRGFPLSYDHHNGTFKTLMALCPNYMKDLKKAYSMSFAEYERQRERLEGRLFENKRLRTILSWLDSHEWVNYYETEHYIFVHSFIPVHESDFGGSYFPSWRTQATPKEWKDATWGCPWRQYLDGLFDEEIKKGKTLVCGHWHTSDFYNNLDGRNNPDFVHETRDCPIYRSERYLGLIGLDACTALSGRVNVLVLSENEL